MARCLMVWVGAGVLILANATVPAAAEPNKALAEHFYATASSAKSPADALAAVNKALEYDAEHLGANLLLAQLLLDGEQVGPASTLLAKIEILLARQGNPAAERAKLELLRGRLAKLRPCVAAWAALKTQYAERYVTFGERPAPVGMPSTALAFARAVALDPDNKQVAGQFERTRAAVPALPSPAEKLDPAGAKLLFDQARRHTQVARYEDALKLLAVAVSLDPDAADAWADLGLCLLNVKEKNLPLATACLLAAREKLSTVGDPAAAKQLEARVKNLLGLADPRMILLGQLDQQLAAAGKALMDKAKAGGDAQTAQEIEAFLAKCGLAPEPPSTPTVRPDDAGNLATKIDLSARAVDVKADNARVQRGRDCVTVTTLDKTQKLDATLTLGTLTFGGDYRMRWRLESLDPAAKPNTAFCCWPSRRWVREYHGGKTWESSWLEALLRPADKPVLAAERKAAYRVDGDNEIAVEKRGSRLTIWINGRKSFVVELTPQQLQSAAAAPFEISFSAFENWTGCKATLLEFRRAASLAANPKFGEDCWAHQRLPFGGGDITKQVDLACDRAVDVAFLGALDVKKQRDHLILSAPEGATPFPAQLRFRGVTYGPDSRIRWRVEPAGGDPAHGILLGSLAPGERSVAQFMPAHVSLLKRPSHEDVVPRLTDLLMRPDYAVKVADRSVWPATYRKDGVYEFCQEKRGNTLNVWCNGRKQLEVRVSDRKAREAANQCLEFWAAPRAGSSVKLTLLELTVAAELSASAPAQPTEMLDPVAPFQLPLAGQSLMQTVDLSSPAVTFDVVGSAKTQLTRQRDHFVMARDPQGDKPGGLAANLTFGQAAGAADARVRWRIEGDGWTDQVALAVHAWPLPYSRQTGVGPEKFGTHFGHAPNSPFWNIQHAGAAWERGYLAHIAEAISPAAYAKTGMHEYCVEKRGRFVRMSINSVPLMLVDLTEPQQKDVENGPMQLWITSSGQVPIKATLLELTVNKSPAPAPAPPAGP